jgi:hypothetical protein
MGDASCAGPSSAFSPACARSPTWQPPSSCTAHGSRPGSRARRRGGPDARPCRHDRETRARTRDAPGLDQRLPAPASASWVAPYPRAAVEAVVRGNLTPRLATALHRNADKRLLPLRPSRTQILELVGPPLQPGDRLAQLAGEPRLAVARRLLESLGEIDGEPSEHVLGPLSSSRPETNPSTAAVKPVPPLPFAGVTAYPFPGRREKTDWRGVADCGIHDRTPSPSGLLQGRRGQHGARPRSACRRPGSEPRTS